jgi:hypothetical protein
VAATVGPEAAADTTGIASVEPVAQASADVWIWRSDGVFRIDPSLVPWELERPGGGPIVNVRGLNTGHLGGDRTIYVWNGDGVWIHDTTSAGQATEITDQQGSSIDGALGVTRSDVSAGSYAWIRTGSHVYLHDPLSGTTLDVQSTTGGSIQGARGVLSLRWGNDNAIYIWTDQQLLLHTGILIQTTSEIERPGGGSIAGIKGVVPTGSGAQIAGQTVFLFNDDHLYWTDLSTLDVTEYILPSGQPVSDIVALLPSWNNSHSRLNNMWAITTYGVFRESDTLGVVSLDEYFFPGSVPMTGILGAITTIDKGALIPRDSFAVFWTANGVFREARSNSTTTEELLDHLGQSFSGVLGISAIEADPLTELWIWTATDVYRFTDSNGVLATERITDGTGNGFAGVRAIVGRRTLPTSSTEDVVFWNANGVFTYRRSVGAVQELTLAGGASIPDAWTVLSSLDLGQTPKYRLFAWNHAGLFTIDPLSTVASEITLFGNSIAPPDYAAPRSAFAVTRQQPSSLGTIDTDLNGAGVVNAPSTVALSFAGRTGSYAALPTAPPPTTGLTSVLADHSGKLFFDMAQVGAIDGLDNGVGMPGLQFVSVLSTPVSVSGNVYYYRQFVTGLECNDIPVADRLPVEEAVIALIDPAVGLVELQSTDTTGRYEFDNVPDSAYRLLPVKQGHFCSAIDPADALGIARASAGVIALGPYQEFAANTSGDQRVAIDDAFLVAVHAAGLLAAFPVAASMPSASEWFFEATPAPAPDQVLTSLDPAAGVQGEIGFQRLVSSVVDQDFCTGPFGDVTGDWWPCPPLRGPAPSPGRAMVNGDDCSLPDATGVSEVTLALPANAGALPDDVTRVPLTVDDPTGMESNHVVIEFESSVADAAMVQPAELLECYTLVSNTEEAGSIQAAWYRSEFCGECNPALDAGLPGKLLQIPLTPSGTVGSSSPLSIVWTDYNAGEIDVLIDNGSFCVLDEPAQVDNLQLAREDPGESVAILSWNPVDVADSYVVYRGFARDGIDYEIFLDGVVPASVEDDGLIGPPGSVVYYNLKATACPGGRLARTH